MNYLVVSDTIHFLRYTRSSAMVNGLLDHDFANLGGIRPGPARVPHIHRQQPSASDSTSTSSVSHVDLSDLRERAALQRCTAECIQSSNFCKSGKLLMQLLRADRANKTMRAPCSLDRLGRNSPRRAIHFVSSSQVRSALDIRAVCWWSLLTPQDAGLT